MNCEWTILRQALRAFVLAEGGHQGSGHIKPLHWYVACRLVLEGGFRPDEITPRPPFRIETRGAGRSAEKMLVHDPAAGGAGERTLLGGLKTKDVDVVVSKDGIGPCLAISVKGTLNAYRNLTNRMEEAAGDCTNLHIAYPALAYGFLHVMRANREGPVPANGRRFLSGDERGDLRVADVAISRSGVVADSITRYGDALSGLAGRKGMRNDLTRYEAVALVLVEPDGPNLGGIVGEYPLAESPLMFESFFERMYRAYDQRFVYGAPALQGTTRRLEWSGDSVVLTDGRAEEFNPRIGT